MADTAPSDTALRLSCRPGKEGHKLVFDYTLHNPGQLDVYVMDAFPTVDRATNVTSADENAVCVILSPQGDAIIGKFVPPLPTQLRVAVPLVPLAHRLAPGGTLERHLEISEPLAETSPYLPDLPLRQYQVVDIAGVVFTIAYWLAGTTDIAAVPAPYAPNLLRMMSATAGSGASLVSQRFPTRGLQVFRRTDQFPRSLAT
jgi:hypothetical protein